MDAGNGSHPKGNGSADPTAALPPSSPPAGCSGQSPEPLVVVDRDPKTGRILPGHSLNPKGRPKGIPNRNDELVKILTSTQLREAWVLAKARAKRGDIRLMEFLLDRVLLKQTPEAAGIAINVNQSNQQTSYETLVMQLRAERAAALRPGMDLEDLDG